MNPDQSDFERLNMKKIDYYYESRYHKMTSTINQKIYYSCPIDCYLCKQWNQPGEIWKFFVFFPHHCHMCLYAGDMDEFNLISRFVVCNRCHSIYLRRLDIIKSRYKPKTKIRRILNNKYFTNK